MNHRTKTIAGLVRGGLSAIGIVLALSLFISVGPSGAWAQSSLRLDSNQAADQTTVSPQDGNVPGNVLGNTSDAEIWRSVRHGLQGNVSIPDKKAGIFIQSGGEVWRQIHTGTMPQYSGWLLLATVIGLAAFFAIRGRIRIDHGRSGKTVERFKAFERFGHWLVAISFIVLAITGLNILFGRAVLIPVIGKDAFATLADFGKVTHNFVGFAFMAGLAVVFVTWVAHNIPNRTDLEWLAKGGGIFTKGVHPPAKKFNAGQKVIFWAVIIGGLSLSVSGWALIFPFEHHFFESTFKVFSAVGIDIPSILGLPDPPYAAVTEQQLNTTWHGIVAIVMICIILAHIYIGSIGMEGAFDAMGNGHVDRNWALEHHSLWMEEVEAENKATRSGDGKKAPAE